MVAGCGVVVSPDESRLRVFTAGDASLVDLGLADAGAPVDATPPPPDASREDIAADLGDDAPADAAAPHDLGPMDDASDVPVGADVPAADGAVTCATGLTACGPACFDLGSDLRHCGSCDRACAESEVCLGGNCQCAAGLSMCGARCVNPLIDPAHCGSCNSACPAGRVCAAGRCACPSGTLESTRGRCVAIQVDPENCGRLGHQCDNDEACVAGVCVCRPGLTLAGTRCVDTQSDHNHCGRVNNRCGDTMACVAGACTGRGACRSPLTLCGADCVDRSRDPLNCGDCGDACGRTDVCIGGSCRTTRPETTCLTCPCAACSADRQLCCASPSAGGFPLCVDASRCP